MIVSTGVGQHQMWAALAQHFISDVDGDRVGGESIRFSLSFF